MRLRSGKVVKSSFKETINNNDSNFEINNNDTIEAAYALLHLKSRVEFINEKIDTGYIDNEPNYVEFDYTNMVNEKIKTIPNYLQYKCQDSLRKVIIESFKKGINIKFEK